MNKIILPIFFSALVMMTSEVLAEGVSGKYETKLNCQFIGSVTPKVPDVGVPDIWYILEGNGSNGVPMGKIRMLELLPSEDPDFNLVIHHEGLIFDDARSPGGGNRRYIGFKACGPTTETDPNTGSKFDIVGNWTSRERANGSVSINGDERIFGQFGGFTFDPEDFIEPCQDNMQREATLDELDSEVKANVLDLLTTDCEDVPGGLFPADIDPSLPDPDIP